MERQKKVLFSLLVLTVLIAGAIVFWLLKYRSVELAGAPVPPPPVVEEKRAEPPPAAAVALKEITFAKTLMIGSKWIQIDEGEATAVPCEQVPQLFGYLKIDAQTTGELTCKDDYMGGTQLRFKDAAGDSRTVDLEQSDGDAGDAWDMRSLISRNKDGRLRIEIISLASRDDIDTEVEEESCSIHESALVWDPVERSFDATDPSGLFTTGKFTLPIGIGGSCLNDKGELKAKSP